MGRELCVYGTVWRAYETNEAFIVEFSREADALYLLSYDYVFPEIAGGDCIRATGEIERLGDNPVMVVRDLYYCR